MKNNNILYIAEIPYETRHWKDYYENGQIAAEGDYVNGQENGRWLYYDENGDVEEEIFE